MGGGATKRMEAVASSRETVDRNHKLGRPFLVAGGVLAVGTLLAFVVAAWSPMDEAGRSALSVSLATAAAASSLPAGLVLVNHYRFGGRRSDLDAGIIVLLTSALLLLPSRAVPVLFPDARHVSPLLGAGIALTVLWLSRPRRASPDEGANSSLSLLFPRVRQVGAVAFALVAMLVLLELTVPGVSVGRTMEPLNVVLFGLGALFMLAQGYRTHQWSLTFIGMHLLGLEIGDSMAIAAESVTDGLWLGACLMSLVAASIGTFGALEVAKNSAKAAEKELLEASLYRIEALQSLTSNEETLHDLRSGLLSVEAFAGSLDRDPSVDLLVEEVARLRAMVSASRQVEVVSLDIELKRVVAARRALGLEVALDLADELWVLGARSDVLEVIQNLLDNASRHAPGSAITVSARTNGPAVVLRVSDVGPGFDEETLPWIFERGFTTNHQGSGLGLHIVQRLVTGLGGTVSAKNRTGGGALIELQLPNAQLSLDASVDELTL